MEPGSIPWNDDFQLSRKGVGKLLLSTSSRWQQTSDAMYWHYSEQVCIEPLKTFLLYCSGLKSGLETLSMHGAAVTNAAGRLLMD